MTESERGAFVTRYRSDSILIPSNKVLKISHLIDGIVATFSWRRWLGPKRPRSDLRSGLCLLLANALLCTSALQRFSSSVVSYVSKLMDESLLCA